MQKLAYELKKKRIFGEGGRGGQIEEGFSLEKMNLDRGDQGAEGEFNPFLKHQVAFFHE